MKQFLIPHELKEYNDFHDKKWFENFFDLIDGTPLEEAGDHFSGNLYASARAFTFPWMLIESIHSSSDNVISKNYIWKKLKQLYSFQAAIGKTSENCYVAIFCSYEDYILQSTKVACGTTILRITDRDFNKKLISAVGSNVAKISWQNNQFALAREIRNSIVHNGGRPTGKLLKQRNLPKIIKDNVLLTPLEVRELYSNVKKGACAVTMKINGR